MLSSYTDGIRVASASDASAIASLFQDAYEESSHECKDVAYVARTMQGDDHLWLVVDEGEAPIAVTCVRRIAWNRSYETCYSITSRKHRGRGLARSLFLASLELALKRDDCELIVGYPRNRTMYELTTTGISSAPIAVGHDGGLNIANGQREVHLITLMRNARLRPMRVISHNFRASEFDSVKRSIVSGLGFDAVAGDYPNATVVGPEGNFTAQILDCEISYRRDPAALNGAVHLTSVVTKEPHADPEEAVQRFIEELGPVSWLGMQVLADKVGFIDRMGRLGFENTAYMPAWYAAECHRYDCVMLVRSRFSAAPQSHGVQDVVDNFRRAYEPLSHGRPLLGTA